MIVVICDETTKQVVGVYESQRHSPGPSLKYRVLSIFDDAKRFELDTVDEMQKLGFESPEWQVVEVPFS